MGVLHKVMGVQKNSIPNKLQHKIYEIKKETKIRAIITISSKILLRSKDHRTRKVNPTLLRKRKYPKEILILTKSLSC